MSHLRDFNSMLLVASVVAACSPSAVGLADRGQFHHACGAAETTDHPEITKRLVARSDARLTITPWNVQDTRKAAGITQPASPSARPFEALVLELKAGKLDPSLAEIHIASPWLRASGWTSRYAGGVGDSYELLMGKPMPPVQGGGSLGDLVSWSWSALRGDPVAKANLANAMAPGETPQDVVDADRLRALIVPSCTVSSSTSCRAVALFVPSSGPPESRPAAIAFTVRYATIEPGTIPQCTLMEHIVIPLAQGSSLHQQLAATFPSGGSTLSELRARARVYGALGEAPFYEEEQH